MPKLKTSHPRSPVRRIFGEGTSWHFWDSDVADRIRPRGLSHFVDSCLLPPRSGRGSLWATLTGQFTDTNTTSLHSPRSRPRRGRGKGFGRAENLSVWSLTRRPAGPEARTDGPEAQVTSGHGRSAVARFLPHGGHEQNRLVKLQVTRDWGSGFGPTATSRGSGWRHPVGARAHGSWVVHGHLLTSNGRAL